METPPPELPLRLYRTLERVTAAAPLPGMTANDITVTVTADDHLIIEAQQCEAPDPWCGELKSAGKDVVLDEWRPGPLLRRDVRLPAAVDASRAHVSHGNGVVVVALPIAQRTTPAVLTVRDVAAPSARNDHHRPATAPAFAAVAVMLAAAGALAVRWLRAAPRARRRA